MTDMPKNAKAICAVGEALFGPTWQTAMASRLGVDRRTIARWARGAVLPPARWHDLRILCTAREADISDAREIITTHLATDRSTK